MCFSQEILDVGIQLMSILRGQSPAFEIFLELGHLFDGFLVGVLGSVASALECDLEDLIEPS